MKNKKGFYGYILKWDRGADKYWIERSFFESNEDYEELDRWLHGNSANNCYAVFRHYKEANRAMIALEGLVDHVNYLNQLKEAR